MISKVSMALLCLYVIFTCLLSLSSILGLAGAIQRKAKWVKIYAELMCMNWFIGVGLGIGHIVKTWRNKDSYVHMCASAMEKSIQDGSEDQDVEQRAIKGCKKVSAPTSTTFLESAIADSHVLHFVFVCAL